MDVAGRHQDRRPVRRPPDRHCRRPSPVPGADQSQQARYEAGPILNETGRAAAPCPGVKALPVFCGLRSVKTALRTSGCLSTRRQGSPRSLAFPPFFLLYLRKSRTARREGGKWNDDPDRALLRHHCCHGRCVDLVRFSAGITFLNNIFTLDCGMIVIALQYGAMRGPAPE